MTTSAQWTPASVIDLAKSFDRFTDQWAPKRIATVNDYDVRIAKLQGEFVWHTHPDTDEFFLVIDGRLTILLRSPDTDQVPEVTLGPGQIFVVPRGIEHCPTAVGETKVLMFEPTGTPNTGDAGGDRIREPENL
ncbi:MAG: cupin domain-containing protein [Sciscionella sp.]|nr:cupin domain-containing protein [Sciscionella sp.]